MLTESIAISICQAKPKSTAKRLVKYLERINQEPEEEQAHGRTDVSEEDDEEEEEDA